MSVTLLLFFFFFFFQAEDGIRDLTVTGVQTCALPISLEQLLILLGARREAADGEIDARGLVAGELAVVQISLVDDLRHDFHAPVLDPEPLDQRLERAVLAVVPEVGALDIEWDALPRGVGRIREREFRIRIVEAPDEPGGRDAINVRPRPRHPRAAVRGQRR